MDIRSFLAEKKPEKSDKSEQLKEEYLNNLTETEKKAMQIAKEHLETSFHVIKSNGFVQYEKSKKT